MTTPEPVDASSDEVVGGGDEERVRAEERARCAKTLHDSVGQALVAASFEAARLVRHAEEGRETVRALAAALAAQLDAAIGLARRVQTEWTARRADGGAAESLGRALARLAEPLARRAGTRVRLRTDVDDARLEPDVARAALACTASALDLVARRAVVSRVIVRARRDDRRLEIAVVDDGRDAGGASEDGSDAAEPDEIVALRARAAASGGAASVVDRAPFGRRVLLRFPIPARPAGSQEPR